MALCALATAAASMWACHTPTNPTKLEGLWGGDHVAMTIADVTHVEFDCAHGDIPAALATDARNRFSSGGTFVREHGGPIHPGDAPDSHPASYSGSVSADVMTLTIRLTDTTETIGTFTLTRGVPGRVLKCL